MRTVGRPSICWDPKLDAVEKMTHSEEQETPSKSSQYDTQRIFATWASMGSHFIGECFDTAMPYLDQDCKDLPHGVRFVVAQLYIDCHLTSESTLILIQYGKEWDADILSRAVMEGTVKFVHMLTGGEDESRRKVQEYWEILPQFSAIRHSLHARSYMEEPDAPSRHIPVFQELVLQETEVKATRREWSKARRKQLEEAWSVAGILREFGKSEHEGLRRLVHMAHAYGMSSHLLHKDADGVGMVWERARRDSHRRIAVILGHSARVVSDMCQFAKWRLGFLLNACGVDTSCIAAIEAKYSVLFDELDEAYRHFHCTEYQQTEESSVDE